MALTYTIRQNDLDTTTFRKVSGSDYARQKIRSRLLFLLGEWFLDTTEGVPWFESILVKNPNLQYIQSTISSVIAAVPGITAVRTVEVQYVPSTRTASLIYEAIYQNGVPVTDVVRAFVPKT